MTRSRRASGTVWWWQNSLVPAWRGLPARMRKALAATIVLTFLALVLLPKPDEEPSAPTRGEDLSFASSTQTLAIPSSEVHTSANAPGQVWARLVHSQLPEFSAAERDPFFEGVRPEAQPSTPVIAQPVVTDAFVGPPAPPTPAPPPPPQFRLLGWLHVDGHVPQLLLGNGQQELMAEPGLQLPDGYVVKSLEQQGVQLFHPATQTVHWLPLPESMPKSSLTPLRVPEGWTF